MSAVAHPTAHDASADKVRALGRHYGNNFYRGQFDQSLTSARVVLSHLWPYLSPASVVDVGCGRGSWLLACIELGSTNAVGLDGPWNDQSKMVDPRVDFIGVDLDKPFKVDERFDLAMSLEVAEHLSPESAQAFVSQLTSLADTVLFAAAFKGQGGTNHINEQRHTYWEALFRTQGFVVFDCVREPLWLDARVNYWYRQNVFLYTSIKSATYARLSAAGFAPMAQTSMMDAVHPELLWDALAQRDRPSFLSHLRDLLPSAIRDASRLSKRFRP